MCLYLNKCVYNSLEMFTEICYIQAFDMFPVAQALGYTKNADMY